MEVGVRFRQISSITSVNNSKSPMSVDTLPLKKMGTLSIIYIYKKFLNKLINRIDLTSVIIPSGGSETVYGWSKDYSNPSIVYNTKEEVFTSFRDLCADGFGSINNRFFAVRASGGSYIWEQEVGPTYGNLIGTKYDMSFDCVSSKGVSSVKAYNAVSIEGNKSASCVFTTEKQTASLNRARFSEKENSFFSGMPTASGTTEYTTVGKVDSVSGNNVTFYNFVNRIPFRVGGDAYLLSGTTLSSLSSTIDSIEFTDSKPIIILPKIL